MLSPTQCKMMNNYKDEKKALQSCKAHLSKILQDRCEYTKVEDPGILLYCEVRGSLSCCFRNMKILTFYQDKLFWGFYFFSLFYIRMLCFMLQNLYYSNQTCSSWANIKNSLYIKSKEYLNNKTKVLERQVTSVGYKTCHNLDGD